MVGETRIAVELYLDEMEGSMETLQDIYKNVFYLLEVDDMNREKYEPRVRATLNFLVNNDELERIKTGVYKK